ncbi:MAG: SCP2 sterol-binding domain-containing protein [Desulfobacterales bacterium]|jgi:putative sterol carrier protein|nr:SCP2 sterol-binding domain-containing protein [Desulfobacterales bacterium]
MGILSEIEVGYTDGAPINGMGMMIGQYLEQNLKEFAYKAKQAQKLNVCTSVEVEKGICTTVRFNKTSISIENGVAQDTHLHLKSSYMAFADVLTGKLSPIKGVMTGEIKIKKFSMKKPFQALKVLRFLKIPNELISRQPTDTGEEI